MATAPRQHILSEPPVAAEQPVAGAAGVYRIIVRDLVLPWRIGVRRHEEDRQQRVRINLDLLVREQPDPEADDYQQVICYERIIENIRRMAASGHVRLAETVAHKVAMMCLTDPRAVEITVRVEKLEAVHDAASVGVEITRSRSESERKKDSRRFQLTEKE